ncbi:hypothetical protein BscR1v2_008240 [Bartonella schoenbuchensis R1]|uniref:Phosphoribosylaminoimidazolesuccinocarboxamide synthase n=1 Tax=Bartonella schoenbuchensis (strain DSM 13525 / NCTC 13165 / R1) TaxID=687861 RepID=A0A1S6XQ80_BARSR|nr:hypothetical protein BscR1v2_008240 [Bartonella schoenbuchensis R1]
MNRRHRIYEGKAKILYEGPEPGTYIQFLKMTQLHLMQKNMKSLMVKES